MIKRYRNLRLLYFTIAAISSRFNCVHFACVGLVTVGYSTERWEKHALNEPRPMTLDLRNRRGTGSLGDLDRAHYDPNFVSVCLDKLVFFG